MKTTQHWEKIDRDYWSSSCGLDIRPRNVYDNRLGICEVYQGMVRLQHALVDAVECEEDEVLDEVVLKGELYRDYYYRDRRLKDYNHRCPYHEDILPNWGKYILL